MWPMAPAGPRALQLVLTMHLAAQLAHPATVTFTGNAILDFAGVDTFTLVDGKDIALDCGFDIRSIRFHYDQASDTAYFGVFKTAALQCSLPGPCSPPVQVLSNTCRLPVADCS